MSTADAMTGPYCVPLSALAKSLTSTVDLGRFQDARRGTERAVVHLNLGLIAVGYRVDRDSGASGRSGTTYSPEVEISHRAWSTDDGAESALDSRLMQ